MSATNSSGCSTLFPSRKKRLGPHVEHPAAAALLHPEPARPFDAILFYDLPGIEFRVPEKPIFYPPPADFMDGIEALLEEGKPLIFMHHAIAGWPLIDRYAEIIGGRYLYQSGFVRGKILPDSGYRMHDVTHRVEPVGSHPITVGLEEGFEIEDELYLHEIFEENVIPLLRSKHEFVKENFYSTELALEGHMFSNKGWDHAPGSNLIAWTRREKASPIVYIQFGHGPATWENPGFKRLLANTIDWVKSDDAKRSVPT